MNCDLFGGCTKYTDITKELLDSIKVGDLVAIQNWDDMYEVRAVSDNYFVMAATSPDYDGWYSICEKKLCEYDYNSMRKNMFHCGTDFWTFGYVVPEDISRKDNPDGVYTFRNPKINESYLASLESGETELSVRSSVPIYELYLKRKEDIEVK
jgi:hypothetical protein